MSKKLALTRQEEDTVLSARGSQELSLTAGEERMILKGRIKALSDENRRLTHKLEQLKGQLFKGLGGE